MVICPERIAVSVIVPVYNVEKYLDRCLDTLAKQTLTNMEIIVVNDGTLDNSQEIIDQYVKDYPNRFISLKKVNGGLSDARNYGLPYACGEYIGFVDSDDYVDVTMYEKLYHKAKEEDSDIVVCGYYGIDEEKASFKQFQQGNMEHFNKSIKENPALLYINSTYAWNKLYRNKLFQESGIRYPKGILFEDMAVTWSIFLHANKISKVDEPLYYYILKRKGSITATYSEKMLQMFDSMALVNEYYQKQHAFKEYYDILCFLNIKHTFIRIRDFSNYRESKLKKAIQQRGIKHLETYFPDWRNCSLFFDDIYGKKKYMRLFRSTFFWKIYAHLPKLKLVKKVIRLPKKAKKVLKKGNRITRYAYPKYCKKPIVANRVLFESFRGTTMSDSPFYMMKELVKDDSYEIYFAVDKNIYQQCLERIKVFSGRVKLVKTYSYKYQLLLATSKYLVTNASFPPYVVIRDKQQYLNTWHGTPLKTLGRKMKEGIADMSNIQRNFLQATMLLYPNQYTCKHMMDDYMLNDLYANEIIINGYPRNTIFNQRDDELEIKKQYGLEKIETIAYMPTWRGATSDAIEISKQIKEVKAILEIIDQSLSDKQKCFVNLHSLIDQKLDFSRYQHIKAFPNDIDGYRFLNSCDALLTDYSSVCFDYSITHKPIALYVYDLQKYISERGMYLDIEKLPYQILKTNEQLVSYLKQAKQSDYVNNQAYYESFIKEDDIDNTKKVNQVFFEQKEYQAKKIEKRLYLMPKIMNPSDIKYLREVLKDPIGVCVFDRKDFTPLTQQMLSDSEFNSLTFIIMDARLALTLPQEIKRMLHFKLKNEIYDKEIKRIFPHITIVDCIDYKQSNYTKGLCEAILRQK